MLGIDRKAARTTWTVFLMALLIATAYAIRETLAVFTAAIFFAYMLSPVVNFAETRLDLKRSRNAALGIVYILLIVILIGLGITLGGRVVDEANNLANRLPSFFQNPGWINKIPLPGWLVPFRTRVLTLVQQQFHDGGKDLIPFITKAGGTILSSLSILLFVVLVPILSFFFLKDGREMKDTLISRFVDPKRQPVLEEILDDIHLLLGQYIRALVLLSLATFTVYVIFLSVTGGGFPILLAALAALLEFIPAVGPATAGIAIILVEGFTGYTHVVWLVIFWAVYRLLQDYVIAPQLMSAGVELHPLLVLFGVIAGEQIAGVPGMFFSVPVIAVLRVIYVRAMRAKQQRELVTVES